MRHSLSYRLLTILLSVSLLLGNLPTYVHAQQEDNAIEDYYSLSDIVEWNDIINDIAPVLDGKAELVEEKTAELRILMTSERQDDAESIVEEPIEEAEAEVPIELTGEDKVIELEESGQLFLSLNMDVPSERVDWLKDVLGDANVTLDDSGKIQSVIIHNSEELVAFSQMNPEDYETATIAFYNNSNQDEFDITSEMTYKDSNNVEYHFAPLGSASAPFSGTLITETVPLRTTYPLFDYLGTATITGDIVISRYRYLADQTASPILANHYVGVEGSVRVQLNEYEEGESVDFSAIIDTMEAGSDLTIAVKNNTSASIVSDNNAGFFCNTMKAGSSLTVSADVTTASVTANGGAAGSLVGWMEEGCSLTAAEGTTIKCNGTIVASGNAGGVVGTCEAGSTIELAGSLSVNGQSITSKTASAGGIGGFIIDTEILLPGIISVDSCVIASNVTTGSASVGGFAGTYVIRDVENPSFVLGASKLNIKNVHLAGGYYSGGLFGLLANEKATNTITIKGYDEDAAISSALDAVSVTYGGLLGAYSSVDLQSSLIVGDDGAQSIAIRSEITEFTGSGSGKKNARASFYGGCIGSVVGDKAAYIRVADVAVTTKQYAPKTNAKADNWESPAFESDCNYYGGVIGALSDGDDSTAVSAKGNFLDIGSIKVVSDGYFRAIVSGGGLVGISEKGVIRLTGTTDLTNCVPLSNSRAIEQSYRNPSIYYAQLVGKRNNTLVYAYGDGIGTGASEDAWKLLRYQYAGLNTKGKVYAVSDIGDWGEVLRITDSNRMAAMITSENMIAHTVTLKAFEVTGDDITISSLGDFASLALNIQLNAVPSGYDSLQFDSSNQLVVGGKLQKNILLAIDSADAVLDFSGTGLTGLLRDDGTQIFQGNFDGGNCVIRMNMGETYGVFGNEQFKYNRGQIYNHAYSGFIGRASSEGTASGSITIKNVTVEGEANFSLVSYGTAMLCGGLIAFGEGNFIIDNVSTAVAITYEDLPGYENAKAAVPNALTGGFIAYLPGGDELTFTNCEWKGSLYFNTQCGRQYNGGFVGLIANSTYGNDINGKGNEGTNTILVKSCKLSGSIIEHPCNENTPTSVRTGNPKTPGIGGMIACMGNTTVESTMTIDGLIMDGLTVKSWTRDPSATTGSGGLWGKNWLNTNVTISGVKISDCMVEATIANSSNDGYSTTDNGMFGGLVFLATGMWKLTGDGITFKNSGSSSQFVGRSGSGLLVYAGYDGWIQYDKTENFEAILTGKNQSLYMEVDYGAYTIEPGAVEVTLLKGSVFDDLVGINIHANGNGIVSIETEPDNTRESEFGGAPYVALTSTSTIWQNGCVVNGATNYQNANTRYYYNLGSLRQYYGDLGGDGRTNLDINGIDSGIKMVLWSVYNHAELNLKNYFANSVSGNITGNIDLTGLSYYPSTDIRTVKNAVVVFDNRCITDAEERNGGGSDAFVRSTSLNTAQHYLMQCGIYKDVTKNLSVDGLTLRGTVGYTKGNTGALVCGTISGASASQIRQISLTNTKLSGIYVYTGKGATEYSLNEAAGLLINKISSYVTLKVSGTGISTTNDYTYTEEGVQKTRQAAGSLIGQVGDSSAKYIQLNFLGTMALDGRIKNGKVANGYDVDYGTCHSIFTRATFMESFQYGASETTCSGIYNFNKGDKCTYGYEISNETSGRNPNNQFWYYDQEVRNIVTTFSDAQNYGYAIYGNYSIWGTKFKNFQRYVYNGNKSQNGTSWELDVNQRPVMLINGCGTYGHPYRISKVNTLASVSDILATGSFKPGFVIELDEDVLNAKNGTTDYHNSPEKDRFYFYDGSTWYYADSSTYQGTNTKVSSDPKAKILSYLRNSYYEIQDNMDINVTAFSGLGSFENTASATGGAFSGVIFGKEKEGIYPTITFTGTATPLQFGGLVKFSQGAVIKDLNLDYSGAKITLSTSGNTGVYETRQFFGGVVGCAFGGDTIIDHVTVKYSQESLQTSLKSTEVSDNYTIAGGYVGLVGGEAANGGGVVFRNIALSNSQLSTIQRYFTDNKTYNPVDISTAESFLYWNPYIGRVLDGYACYDSKNSTISSTNNIYLNNTNKNYQIPNLTAEAQINVDVWSSGDTEATVSVKNAQELWLLSAVVNSGAGAVAANGVYPADNKAYSVGKVRSGLYSDIGAAVCPDWLINDESAWGGESGTSRVPYLIRNFSNVSSEGKYGLSRICGTDSKMKLMITDDCDMSVYQNGFRGIGPSYLQGETLFTTAPTNAIKTKLPKLVEVDGKKESGKSATVTIDKVLVEHIAEPWHVYGIGGVFSYLYTQNTLTIQNLNLIGSVEHNLNKKYEKDIAIGGVAAAVMQGSSGTIVFNNIQLGSDEEAVSILGSSVDANLNSTRYGGGIVGYLRSCSAKFVDCGFQNLSVDGVYYAAGGFAGFSADSVIDISYSEESKAVCENGQFAYRAAQSGTNYGAGGFVGYSPKKITITNARVANIRAAGGCTGGFVGRNNNDVANYITNCEMSGFTGSGRTDVAGYSGGLFGYVKGITLDTNEVEGIRIFLPKETSFGGGIAGQIDGTLTVKNMLEIKDVKAIVNGAVGGFAGKAAGSNIENTVVKDCCLVSRRFNTDSGVGGFIGNAAGTIKGYNILSQNNVVGYLIKNGNELDSTASTVLDGDGNVDFELLAANNIGLMTASGKYHTYADYVKTADTGAVYGTSYAGIWVGNTGADNREIQLIAVHREGDYSAVHNFGRSASSSNTRVIYADYDFASAPKMADTAKRVATDTDYPYISQNPVYSFEGISGTGLLSGTKYGDGIGLSAGDTPTANIIASDLADSKYAGYTTAYKYFYEACKARCPEGVWNYAGNFSPALSSGVFTGNSLPTENFAVLVISDASTIDTQIKDAFALITNSGYTNTVINSANLVECKAFTWNAGTGKYVASSSRKGTAVPKDNIGAVWYNTSTKKFIARDKVYDINSNTFTMITLDVGTNPVVTSEHYYVSLAVVVQKSTEFKFFASNLNGTTYAVSPYTSVTNPLMTSYGDAFTSMMTYEFDRTAADWKSALELGESLLTTYDKIVWLGTTKLPAGTTLLLVDGAQGGKVAYKYEVPAGTILAKKQKLKFSDFVDSAGNKWKDVPICDLLKPAATQNNGSGKFAVAEDVSEAKIRCSDGKYYRLATETDAEKYDIAFGVSADTKVSYQYFLTIKTPANETGTLINNVITYEESWLQASDGLPAKNTNPKQGSVPYFTKTKDSKENRYIICNFFEQDMKASSENSANLVLADTASTVELIHHITDTISLNNSDVFRNYKADTTSLYQRIDMSLKQVDEDNAKTPVEIQAGTKYRVVYHVSAAGSEVFTKEYSGEIQTNCATYSFGFASDTDLDNMVSYFTVKGYDEITVTTDIILTYDNQTLYNQFSPNVSGSEGFGIEYNFASNLSMEKNTISSSTQKVTSTVTTHFSRAAYDLAKLSYNATDSAISSERSGNTSKLGINAFRNEEYDELLYEPSPVTSFAEYDVTAYENVGEGYFIACKMQLLRKNEEGVYEPITGTINRYMTSVLVQDKNAAYNPETNTYDVVLELSEQEREMLKSLAYDFTVTFDVYTGAEMPDKYANYRVILTADLLDSTQNSMDMQASDYIIYTNAKINPAIQK